MIIACHKKWIYYFQQFVEKFRADETKNKKHICTEYYNYNVCGYQQTNKLRGLSPHANYTERAAAAGRRS